MLKNPSDVMSDNVPLKCHQQETVGYLPVTCVAIKPHLKSQYDPIEAENVKPEKIPPKNPPQKSSGESEACVRAEGLKRQYVVVASPLSRFVTQE